MPDDDPATTAGPLPTAAPASTEPLPPASLPALPGLSGTLSIPAAARALVILVQAGDDPDHAHVELAAVFQRAAIATLTTTLLSADEERFADAHHDTTRLTQRLLALLARVRLDAVAGLLPELPLALYASGEASPVCVRAAAQRDREVAALVCHGGLIDRAGLLFLRTLAAPMLIVVADDPAPLATCRRLLSRVDAAAEICGVAGAERHPPSAETVATIGASALAWFDRHLPAPSV
jgi:hypothetical protein